jgi:hypothetical protein
MITVVWLSQPAERRWRCSLQVISVAGLQNVLVIVCGGNRDTGFTKQLSRLRHIGE